MRITTKRNRAYHRGLRVRSKMHGTATVPRLSVFRSLKHMYAQLIDDDAGRTIVSVSDAVIKNAKGTKTDRAKQLGILLGEKALAAKVQKAVFDRGSSRYHGRIAAFAEGVRSKGITF